MSKTYWTEHKDSDKFEGFQSAGVYVNHINIEMVAPIDDGDETKRSEFFNEIKDSIDKIIKKYHD